MVPEARYSGGFADISEYCQFDWYDYVWYMDPKQEKHLGRWIGVAKDVGGPMTFWILPKSGVPLPRSSVVLVTKEERNVDGTKVLMKQLDDGINQRLGDHLHNEDLLPEKDEILQDEGFPWDDLDQVPNPQEPESQKPEANEMEDPDVFDKYIGAEISLNRGGQVLRGKVKARKQDSIGNPVGRAASNPLLDTREYEVEFVDGSTQAYTTNIIAEAMYSQIDIDGHSFALIKEINDHRKDGTAVPIDDAFVETKTGWRYRRRTTKGWQLNVLWKDGSSDWLSLKDLKESYPVQVTEYATTNKIASEPAFAWWIKDVLRK